MTGNTQQSGNQSGWSFLQGVYTAGGRPYFDAVANHSYPGNSPETCNVDANGRSVGDQLCGVADLRNVMVAQGDAGKDIWMTETGYSTCTTGAPCYGFSEATQADYLTRTYNKLATYPYLRVAIWYNFRNTYFENNDPNNWEANLGLLHVDFTTKPSYTAFQTYAAAR